MAGEDNPGRVWARFKLDWLDQVADDLEVDHLAFRVAHTIARLADSDTGINAWSQVELARRAKACRRSLQSAIETLEGRGHLTTLSKANRKLGNRYRPLLKTTVPHAQPDAHDGPFHAQPVAHENASHAQNPTVSCASHCASIPVMNPRIESSSSVRDVTAPTTTKDASQISDVDLLARLRQAAGGKVEDGSGIHNLQPVRALIAEGADLDRHILPTVAAKVSALHRPLGRWSARFLVDAIREAMRAAPGPAATATAADPTNGATTIIRGVAVPDHRILRRVRDYLETGVWPDDVRDRWGPAPDEFGTCIPPRLFRWAPADGPMPTVRIAGVGDAPEGNVWLAIGRWRRGQPWHVPFGPEPDCPDCWLPQRFRQPPRTAFAPREPMEMIP